MSNRLAREPLYDVCIIGAGVAGALIAHRLRQSGLKVIMFDAGPWVREGERLERMQQHLQGKNPWLFDSPIKTVFTSRGEWPYSLRGKLLKAVGGSTHHWGGVAFRHHQSDFEMRSRYGIAEDWPIGYSELEAYYGLAEKELGVAGASGDPFASYRSSEYPLPAFPFSYADKEVIIPACNRLGIKVHPVPYAP